VDKKWRDLARLARQNSTNFDGADEAGPFLSVLRTARPLEKKKNFTRRSAIAVGPDLSVYHASKWHSVSNGVNLSWNRFFETAAIKGGIITSK
jgi:hypothetical protein